MPRLVRILKGVESVYLDGEGRLHLVYSPTTGASRNPWIKTYRGNARAVKDHRFHPLSPAVGEQATERNWRLLK